MSKDCERFDWEITIPGVNQEVHEAELVWRKSGLEDFHNQETSQVSTGFIFIGTSV
jgi:hypothetical protein